VQESVPERLEVKHALYAEIEPALADDVVIASSSSGFMPSEFQRGAAHPERFVLAHPFNPPHLVPLVEVLGGAATDPAAVDWAYAFYEGCGKDPIRLKKEVPGHVANRLQAAMWREAIHLVASGVASVTDVDKAITAGPGLRWAIIGPHMTFHLASGGGGMRVFAERFREAKHRWWDDLGAPYLTPEVVDALCEGLEEEEAGRGFEEIAADRDRKLVRLLGILKD
jgi:3-hydroxybutyryl-CoA dehydrogenase